MSSILRYTKLAYETFREVNGVLKVNTSSQVGKMGLSDRSYAFLKSYIDFVMNSGLISEVTKIYLKSIENNPMDAIRAYNSLNEGYKLITPKQASNHIYYDTKRLLELFPDDMLMKIMHKKGDIQFYEDVLQNAINRKMGRNTLGKISVLQLPAIPSSEKPTDDELDRFFTMLAPYTKNRIKYVEEKIPKQAVSYINYISTKKNPTADEQEILQRLEHLQKAIPED